MEHTTQCNEYYRLRDAWEKALRAAEPQQSPGEDAAVIQALAALRKHADICPQCLRALREAFAVRKVSG